MTSRIGSQLYATLSCIDLINSNCMSLLFNKMEATSQIENLMIAANVNTVINQQLPTQNLQKQCYKNGLDYNRSLNLIAYAAANSVLILDPQAIHSSIPKVLFSLRGHTDRVNAVQWITDTALVTISSDRSIIIWECQGSPRNPQSWTHKVIADAHANAINYLRAYSQSNELYILTMCSGGTLKLWQGLNVESIQFKDELLFGKNLQETMGLIPYGERHLLMAVGGYDMNIHIYLIPRIPFQGGKTFKYKFSLLGHMNAIRAFAFTQSVGADVRYMASCSQDTYIRLWKIQPLENLSAGMGGHQDLKQQIRQNQFQIQEELCD